MTDQNMEQAVIASLLAGKSYRETAREHGISRSRVGRIKAAWKECPSLADPDTETPAGPAPEPAAMSGESGVSPSVSPDAGRDRPSSPTERYASILSNAIAETRELLRHEPSVFARQQIEALLADIEARSEQVLRTVERTLARQEQERQARPDRVRQALAALGNQLVRAESKLRDREQAQQALPGSASLLAKQNARRQVEHVRAQVKDLQRAMSWREAELEKALEAAA